MKTNIRNLFYVIAVLILVFLLAGCKAESGALGVNDVASDPGAFSGPLTLVGIVNAYSKTDPTVVGIMDKKELQCTTPNCKKVLLPVKIKTSRPALGDELQVSGSFIATPGGTLFNAETVTVLTNHNLGGQR